MNTQDLLPGLSRMSPVVPVALCLWMIAGCNSPYAEDYTGDGYVGSVVRSRVVQIVTIGDASTLDASGKPYEAIVSGPNIHFHSPLHDLLAGTYAQSGTRIVFRTDPASAAKFRSAIRRFPNFPFSYYALAIALKKQNDPQWLAYARQAVAIFDQTTGVAGCNEQHFLASKELEIYLGTPS